MVRSATVARAGKGWLISAASPLGVVGHTLPVDEHTGLVAVDDSVVSRRGDHEVSGAELLRRPVVHRHRHPPGHDVGHMRCLTRLRTRDRLDVLRPPPARVERSATHGAGFGVDNLQLSFSRLEGASLTTVNRNSRQATTGHTKLLGPLVPDNPEGSSMPSCVVHRLLALLLSGSWQLTRSRGN